MIDIALKSAKPNVAIPRPGCAAKILPMISNAKFIIFGATIGATIRQMKLKLRPL
jgi:hypothetical protein